MERRNLLKMIMAVTGSIVVGGDALAYTYSIQKPIQLSKTVFTPEDATLFNEIADVILPRTHTPGAKDANVGEMALILVNDCYTKAEKDAFITGFHSINKLCKTEFGKPYLLLSSKQKQSFVTALDEEAKAFNQKTNVFYVGSTPSGNDNPNLPHYFTKIKQLTLFSFFTSKVGATEVLRFEAVPGKYNGNLDYKKGDRAWAT